MMFLSLDSAWDLSLRPASKCLDTPVRTAQVLLLFACRRQALNSRTTESHARDSVETGLGQCRPVGN